MKVALLADTHYGVRNDAPVFMDMTDRFMSEVAIPAMVERGVRQVIHLGDILDRRKYVAFATANRMRDEFILPLFGAVERFDLILGNHDVVYKNTNDLSGAELLLRDFEPGYLRVYDRPCEVALLDDTRALYVPWINDGNREETLASIQKTRAQLCFGHLELEGFDMRRDQPNHEGMDPKHFNKFDMTFSGHFHHKSSKNGIHYLGAHGEFDWGDYDDPRGFHVFDTETRELEFIPNPYSMFAKVHYADDVLPEVPDVGGKYVKVIVHDRKNQVKFEQFISRVEQCNPIDVQVVDDHLNAGDLLDGMEEIDEGEDTLSIFRKALDATEGDFDPDRLDKFITDLYTEALIAE